VQNLKMFRSRSLFRQTRSGVAVKIFRLRTPLLPTSLEQFLSFIDPYQAGRHKGAFGGNTPKHFLCPDIFLNY